MPWCLTTSRRAADADVLLLQLSQPAELEVGVGSLVDFANLQPQIGIRKTHQAFRLHLERGVIQGHANGVVHSHSDISRPLSGICSGREQRPRCDNQTDDATAPQRCSDWLIPRCGVKSYFFCPGRGIIIRGRTVSAPSMPRLCPLIKVARSSYARQTSLRSITFTRCLATVASDTMPSTARPSLPRQLSTTYAEPILRTTHMLTSI
jgi:hypothetical protein